MLPDAPDNPAEPPELTPITAVSSDVPTDLRAPELDVALRLPVVDRTLVPEATLHEDGETKGGDDDVRGPRKAPDVILDPRARAAPDHLLQQPLRATALAPDLRHQARALTRTEVVRHQRWLLDLLRPFFAFFAFFAGAGAGDGTTTEGTNWTKGGTTGWTIGPPPTMLSITSCWDEV